MEYAELQEKFPFLSCIRHSNNEYVGILLNQDQFVTSIYIYDAIQDQDKKQLFLELGEIWWWESNRTIPINIFLNREFEEFKSYIKTFTTKDVEIVFGPKTSLNNVLKKRIIRRNISLIKKNNE
tara:strand:+ start:5739 stop:6110 length:372 start_codon:yes stop_codon:yes gene_type:complete